MAARTAKAVPTEHEEQAQLVRWAKAQTLQDGSALGDYLIACPNGASLTQHYGSGGRYSPQAAKLKAEGMSVGFPDLFLFLPRGGYHGMAIEMKRARKSLSRVSPEQLEWQRRLIDQGYMAVIAYGASQAQDAILSYLSRANSAAA